MITLKDLAAAVGVSPSAVSLVLNDLHRGRVNEKTAARVREMADSMGYVPNALARGLRTKRTHTVGVLSDGVASVPFAGRMLEGVQSAAWEAGYLAMIIDTTNRAELTDQSSKSLLQRDIEAMILAADYHRTVGLTAVPPAMPVVVLNGVPADGSAADSVVPDEAGGAHSAVSSLLQAGHRRIAFCVVGGDRFIASRLRHDGYRQALVEHGVDEDASLVVEVPDPSTTHAYEPVRRLLERPDRPTAVFCFSDQIAFAVYQASDDLGIRIPEDLSVIGFDDQEFIADALRPGLTTVRLPHYAMGAWAARRAIERLHGDAQGPAIGVTVPCPLIERGSVAPPPR
ncbi:LacI family DNA-binding transcriptional regulator [Microbacterium sp.]|uniref:LacI family DNA-binding transcriptional regulator n=1 Tax=Microbacterium sp. TaxID=51671 RepID=UPI00281170B1|nr:LacI family DNA-binding transcriptional regulator [Microbacterium sp.]